MGSPSPARSKIVLHSTYRDIQTSHLKLSQNPIVDLIEKIRRKTAKKVSIIVQVTLQLRQPTTGPYASTKTKKKIKGIDNDRKKRGKKSQTQTNSRRRKTISSR